MKLAICCDFDGTITLTDTGKELLNTLTDKDWQSIDQFVIDGEIGTRAALIEQWGMIEHTTMQEIFSIVDRIKIDPTFIDFYKWTVNSNIYFIILSDGFETYIKRILEKQDIDLSKLRIKSNDMDLVDNKIKLKFLTENCEHDCANCKYSHVLGIKDNYDKIVYIGDGLSDILPAKELADYIFARKNEDLAIKLESDSRLIEFTDFVEIQKYLEKL
jgi:2-hydroxy-3-keto-5-methylthiopentenyl-1-phosphate phosphatase